MRADILPENEGMRHLLTLPATNGHTTANAIATNTMATAAGTDAVQEQLERLGARIVAHQAKTKRPFVTLSYAQSLDGSIAARLGQRLRLSSPEAMTVTHALRAQHDAIVVGIGTVLIDNPKLTVRMVEGSHPQPIVLDSHLRMPLDARLLGHPKSVWVATTLAKVNPEKVAALEERGVKVLSLSPNGVGRVNLAELLDQLGDRGVRSVMVEGGAQIMTSFLTERLIDMPRLPLRRCSLAVSLPSRR